MEPTSDVGGDNYTVEVIIHMINNSKVPRFRDQNYEDRKQNGDMLVTSLRWETHRSGELTDTLDNNTDEATRSWSGDVSGNIGIHTWTLVEEIHT